MSSVQSTTGNTVDPSLLTTMNGAKTATSASSTKEAQDRFITLLVTQMRNQDPLNPMDNAQVTSQLAQLSTVTGIEKLNDTVASLNNSYIASQSMQAAGMIGRAVVAPGSSLNLASGKSSFGIELSQPADKVDVSIIDANGAVVQTLSLGATPSGTSMFTWDGAKDAGGIAADGNYQIKITASSAGTKVDTTTLSVGMVNSVTTGAGGVKLAVNGIGDVPMTDVRQIF
jgi:flagellar basal-body rod modification protein FlgD